MAYYLCSSYTEPRKRMILHPLTSTNTRARSFYSEYFKPGFVFDSSSVEYVCREPCYSLLEKGSKKVAKLNEILLALMTKEQTITKVRS